MAIILCQRDNNFMRNCFKNKKLLLIVRSNLSRFKIHDMSLDVKEH